MDLLLTTTYSHDLFCKLQLGCCSSEGDEQCWERAPSPCPWVACPAPLTCAVLGYHGVPVVAGRAELAVRARRVVHAARAGACQGVTAAEQHVGIRVPAAVTGLARAADHQGVAEVPRGTPGETLKLQQGEDPAACTAVAQLEQSEHPTLVTAAALGDLKALCVLLRDTSERCLYHRLQVKAKHM